MTYAIGKNVETCAGPSCVQPAEGVVPMGEDRIDIGFCLDHMFQLEATLEEYYSGE